MVRCERNHAHDCWNKGKTTRKKETSVGDAMPAAKPILTTDRLRLLCHIYIASDLELADLRITDWVSRASFASVGLKPAG